MKKKTEKVTKNKINYEPFREYLEKQVIYNHLADGISSEIVSENEEDENDIIFRFDCGGYTVKITCNDLINIDIEYSFKYPNCDTEFTLEDVFNVLDIHDFNEYFYFAKSDDEEDQKKTIDDLLNVIKKYDYDIRKAGKKEYLEDMEKMHQADEALYNSDALKFRTIFRMSRLKSKMQSKKDEKSKRAFLKEMQKLESKNLLNTYDKRYKSYIEQGYPIPDNYDSEDNEDYIGYSKKALLNYIICIACGVILSFAIFFIDRSIISSKGIYVSERITYISALVAGGFIGYLINRIFGTKIITALSPEDQKEYVKKERSERYDANNIISRFWSKYIVFIGSVIAAPLILIVACSGVCFNNDAIIDHSLIINSKVSYNEAEVYLVKGWFDDDNNYIEYEAPCYRIKYDETSETETGEIHNKNDAEKIEQLLKANNVKVTETKD